MDLVNIVGEFGYLSIYNFGAHLLSPSLSLSLNNCNCKPLTMRNVIDMWALDCVISPFARNYFTLDPFWGPMVIHFSSNVEPTFISFCNCYLSPIMRIYLPHEKNNNNNNLGEGDNFSMTTPTRDLTNFTKMVPLMHQGYLEGCRHLL